MMESEQWRKNMQRAFTIPWHGRIHVTLITKARAECANGARKNSKKGNAA